jgi:hypothetical protein
MGRLYFDTIQYGENSLCSIRRFKDYMETLLLWEDPELMQCGEN